MSISAPSVNKSPIAGIAARQVSAHCQTGGSIAMTCELVCREIALTSQNTTETGCSRQIGEWSTVESLRVGQQVSESYIVAGL